MTLVEATHEDVIEEIRELAIEGGLTSLMSIIQDVTEEELDEIVCTEIDDQYEE